jgi:hypothetical protein
VDCDSRQTAAAIERLSAALGPPVCTPELLADGQGGLERAHYRVWKWPCPACGAGEDDPFWRPLTVDSNAAGARLVRGRHLDGRDAQRA